MTATEDDYYYHYHYYYYYYYYCCTSSSSGSSSSRVWALPLEGVAIDTQQAHSGTHQRDVKINKVLVDADGLLLCSVTLLSEACGSSAAMQIWKYIPSKTSWHHQVEQMEAGSKKSALSQVLIFTKQKAAKLNLSMPGRHGDASCLPTGSLFRCLRVWIRMNQYIRWCKWYLCQNTCFLTRPEWKWSHFAMIPTHWWILDDYLIIVANWPTRTDLRSAMVGKKKTEKRLRKTKAEGAVSSNNWPNPTVPIITQYGIRWSAVF